MSRFGEYPTYYLSDKTTVTFCRTQIYLEAGGPSLSMWLSNNEMATLMRLFVDGRCPVCYEEMQVNDVVCDTCFKRARQEQPAKEIK